MLETTNPSVFFDCNESTAGGGGGEGGGGEAGEASGGDGEGGRGRGERVGWAGGGGRD